MDRPRGTKKGMRLSRGIHPHCQELPPRYYLPGQAGLQVVSLATETLQNKKQKEKGLGLRGWLRSGHRAGGGGSQCRTDCHSWWVESEAVHKRHLKMREGHSKRLQIGGCKGGRENVSKSGAGENVRPETAPSPCGWSARTLPTLAYLRQAISHIWGDLPNIVQHHSGDRKARALLQCLCDLCVWGEAQERLSVCQEPAGGHSVHIHSAISVYVEHQAGIREGPRE